MDIQKNTSLEKILYSEAGRVGYFILWLMGVPASLLLVIFLIRGH